MNFSYNERKKWLIIVLIQAVFILGLWAYAVVYINDTNIVDLKGYVNDYAHIINLDYLEKIRKICIGFKEKENIDMVVVTIDSAKPYANDEYATRLLKKWNAASRNSSGGILMLVSKNDGVITLEVSPNIDFVLPKTVGSKILDDHVIPMFNQANETIMKNNQNSSEKIKKIIGKGIHDGILAIITRISDMSKIESFKKQIEAAQNMGQKMDDKKRKFYLSILYFLLMAIVIVVAYVLYKLFVYRCEKCKFKVRISNEIISAPTKEKPGLTIQSYSCKRCGYTDNKRIITYYTGYYLSNIFNTIKSILKKRKRRKKRERKINKFKKSSK